MQYNAMHIFLLTTFTPQLKRERLLFQWNLPVSPLPSPLRKFARLEKKLFAEVSAAAVWSFNGFIYTEKPKRQPGDCPCKAFTKVRAPQIRHCRIPVFFKNLTYPKIFTFLTYLKVFIFWHSRLSFFWHPLHSRWFLPLLVSYFKVFACLVTWNTRQDLMGDGTKNLFLKQ